MGEVVNIDDPDSQFPVGMRVLAVDDNSTCLMILETMLRKCRYNVTTASEATMALKLLRESNSKFDLVISDVHNVPDMDGFQLLESVGLEMDLPVIMLSADDDPSMVLKGINHGACGYLLKPVRMQEVKNIWQHVYRRKKVMLEDQTLSRISCVDEPPREKVGKKRRDENGNRGDNLQRQDEDPSRTRKKTRLNWSPELHMKFIAVVNQLGIEKAVPKKILEMMDDVNLTREHIASHLQKYRLTLKRVSQMENEQGRAPLFACSSFSYAQSGLRGRDGVASFSQFLGPGKFQGRALMPSLTSPVLAQSTTNQPSHAQGSHDFKFTDRTVDSFPCWTQDMATSSHSCFTRSQDWYSHSPIHVACNEPAKQESSTPSYNIHEDPAAFLLPVEVDSGESHCQGAHIDMVVQESLAFTEQPDTGLPSIPSLHGL